MNKTRRFFLKLIGAAITAPAMAAEVLATKDDLYIPIDRSEWKRSPGNIMIYEGEEWKDVAPSWWRYCCFKKEIIDYEYEFDEEKQVMIEKMTVRRI